MTHKQLTAECEALGLKVERVPDVGGAKSFNATRGFVRVYWRTSLEDSLLGLPRVSDHNTDTHARSIREVRYLVQRS